MAQRHHIGTPSIKPRLLSATTVKRHKKITLAQRLHSNHIGTPSIEPRWLNVTKKNHDSETSQIKKNPQNHKYHNFKSHVRSKITVACECCQIRVAVSHISSIAITGGTPPKWNKITNQLVGLLKHGCIPILLYNI